jgi:heptosyltransferase III
MNIEASTIHQILVIQVSRIGDTLLATPAIRAIAAAYPQAKITCLAHPNRAEVLQNLPFIQHLGTITKKTAPLRGWLPGKHYDLAVVFGFDQALITYALRVAHKVAAFRQPNPSLNERLSRTIDVPAFQSKHAVDYLLTITDALDIPPAGKHLSYSVSPAEEKWAHDRLAPLRSIHAKPLIGMQIASFPTKGYRDWPVTHFIELCHRIRTDYPHAHFLIFGGTLEHERTQALHAALPGYSTHYAGTLTLRQTGALMNEIDLYVGVDTGPTHIMGALHRPMVAMYHGSAPSYLYAPLEHPCLWAVDHPRARQGNQPSDTPMSDISVDTLLTKAHEALTSP